MVQILVKNMKIIPHRKRFAIADDNGKIIDDAGGWGYKTIEKANKAMWYKFKGGKEKMDRKEEERKEYFNKYKGLEEFIYSIWENNFKEIYRGEFSEQDILDAVKKEFGIDLPKEYI